MKAFLDANIWIDFLLVREPFYLPAVTLLTLAEQGRLELVVSAETVVTSNYVCCERSGMSQSQWRAKLIAAHDLVSVQGADSAIIYEAASLDWADYEDAVQYLTAWSSGCDCIVTRNPKDFKQSAIPVLSADELIVKVKGKG